MKMKDKITIYNEFNKPIVVTYEGGLKQQIMKALGIGCFANDLITDGGLADVADMILDRYDYISLGTGTTIPTRSDTQLETESFTREQCTEKSLETTYYVDDTARLTAEFIPAFNTSVTESGIHKNATSSGDIMFARETFAPMAMTANITYPVVWDIIVMR